MKAPFPQHAGVVQHVSEVFGTPFGPDELDHAEHHDEQLGGGEGAITVTVFHRLGGGATDSPSSEPKPEVSLWHGLKERINRYVFYQLVEQASVVNDGDTQLVQLISAGKAYTIGSFHEM